MRLSTILVSSFLTAGPCEYQHGRHTMSRLSKRYSTLACALELPSQVRLPCHLETLVCDTPRVQGTIPSQSHAT